MCTKIKGRLFAAVLALALIFTAIPCGGIIEADAASKTKVMETKVDFSKSFKTGDDSSISLDNLIVKTNVALGKQYTLKTKIYVPAEFIEAGGLLYLIPNVELFKEGDYRNLAAFAKCSNGISYDFTSDEVIKTGDFYVIDASCPIDVCYDNTYSKEIDFPTGSGKIAAGLFVVGQYCDYKGSICFDDVELVVDEKVVATVDYEDGAFGKCAYRMNTKNRYLPKVVSFSGKALDVSKNKLTIKKGKKSTIKATAIPDGKITFSSSNKKIATVTSKGVVKGIKKGNATITVKGNGKTIKVKVKVK